MLGASSLTLASCANVGTPTTSFGAAPRDLDGVKVTLAPRNASPAQQLAHYEKIIEAMGGRLSVGRTHVLGLRGLAQNGTLRDTVADGSSMRDTFVVLRKGSNGSAHVQHFRGSSYPGQARSGASPDVNGDGVGDVGMIREGRYRAVPNGDHSGKPSYHVLTPGGAGRLPGVRDTDHDGRHSASEWERSRARGDTLGAVLFHRAATDGSVSSIGCMNVPEIDEFVSSVGSTGASFDFTLVNALRRE